MLSCSFMLSLMGSMEPIIQAFTKYMLKNLGLQLDPESWKGDKKVPFFLQDLYLFFSVSLLGKACLLAVPKGIDAATPAAIKNHLLLLREISGLPCIYLTTSISSYNRQRLAQHGVQFVIPNHQIYLPAIGVDWMERYWHRQKHRTSVDKQLAPSSQAVVIHALIHHEKTFTPLELAKTLNYTPMTMTRALNELELFGIGKTVRKGKERVIRFTQDASKIWKKSLPFLQNPVKKQISFKFNKK